MNQAFYYSATAGLMTLQVGLGSTDTTVQLDTTVGLPGSMPFTLVLDPGQLNEEIITVTDQASLTLTVLRGENGSVGQPHDAGARVLHMLVARDLTLSRQHEASTTAHGLSSDIVGVDDIQTLTHKSINGSVNTLTNVPISSIAANVATTDTAQTLTNKTLTAPVLGTPVLHGGTGDGTLALADVTAATAEISGAVSTGALTASSAHVTGASVLDTTLSVAGASTLHAVAATTLAASGAATAQSLVLSTFAPVMQHETADATYVANAWTDFGSGMAAFTAVVPPSGRIEVTVTATLANTSSATASIWHSFRWSSGSQITAPASGSFQSVYQDNVGSVYVASGTGHTAVYDQSWWGTRQSSGGGRGSTTTIFGGLTPGDTVTITPQYFASSIAVTPTTTAAMITVRPLA